MIFEGLLMEYDAFVTGRLDPYTVEEIESLLLAHEARVEENHQSALSDALWVNVAQTMPKYKSVTSHPTSNPSPL